jgi:CheY-like chemotaxis protein
MSGTIVVIEDDAPSSNLIKNVLSKQGYHVALATNGESGIHLTRELMPDLVIMDLRLPKMNGWEATKILAGDSHTAHIPILAVSVEIDTSDLTRAMNAGCVDYLQKPFDITRLREIVREYCQG